MMVALLTFIARAQAATEIGYNAGDTEKRLARGDRAQHAGAGGNDSAQLPGGFERSAPGFPAWRTPSTHDVSRQPGSLGRPAFNLNCGDGPATLTPIPSQVVTQYYFTIPASDLETALNIEAVRCVTSSARRSSGDKSGGAIEQEAREISQTQSICFILAFEKMFLGDALCSRRPRYASRPSKDDGRCSKILQKMVCPQHRHLGHCRRCGSADGSGYGQAAVRAIPRRTVPARATIRLQPLKSAND